MLTDGQASLSSTEMMVTRYTARSHPAQRVSEIGPDTIAPETDGRRAHHELQDRLLTLSDVLQLVGASKSWLYKQMNAGKFPKRLKLSHKVVRWSEKSIRDWIAQACVD